MPNSSPITTNHPQPPTIAIIGAGASGLMVADYLKDFAVTVQVFEQKPSPARKLLMAGKSGLNISHAEPLANFVNRYHPNDWLTPHIHNFNAKHIQDFMANLGIESFVGSTGRIFPTMMKASPLLRAWLQDLDKHGVQFFYRHSCTNIDGNQATFSVEKDGHISEFTQQFDAIVLACGGLSWSRLGSDGKWQNWLNKNDITPFYPSNVGIVRTWSSHLTNDFGKALKRVKASVKLLNGTVDDTIEQGFGDIVISHYGMESGLIYRLNHAMREQCNATGKITLQLDLLPDISHEKLLKNLNNPKKQSLSNVWRKAGLDPVKIALLREIVPKVDWHDGDTMAQFIKNLTIEFDSFRPIEEAISCGGGVKRSALTEDFALKSNPNVFCCGEMLDWDAPTGGYLLTACFATSRAVGAGVVKQLNTEKK
ncbi:MULTISPECIES: TIGR03862 family flavoprotein [unclassified Moraxella]|uniref:TIGR03862 family flavoprotein n=1 Tax=unclassified Moraxella TaxID=2685852 RepID=UPI003AF7162D